MAGKQKELYKRPQSASWWYRFTNPKTSRQERGSTKTADRKLAQQILNKIKSDCWFEIKTVDEDEGQEKLWIEAVTKWYEVKKTKKSIGTDIKRLKVLAPVLDEIPLSQINDDFVIKEIVNSLLKKRNVAPATVNRYIDLIRGILNASVRWNYLDKSPYLTRPGIEAERQRKAWLTPDQFKRAHEAMSPLKAKLMLHALCTGMRADNIVSLHPKNVDLLEKRIIIAAKDFKSKRSHVVPLNNTALKLLKSEIGTHPDAVFTENGLPFKRYTLKGWHEVFDDLGINGELRESGLLLKGERFVFHGMRHTFATWLYRTGVPLDIIQTLGGWSKGKEMKMVSIYTHIDDVAHLLPYVRNIDLVLEGKKNF